MRPPSFPESRAKPAMLRHLQANSPRGTWLWFLGCFLSLLPTQTFAAGEGLDLMGNVPNNPSPEIVGIRPMGMGNAGLGLADGPEAFMINPAGLARYRGSFLEAGFYFHPAADHRVFNASIADAQTNPVLAGGGSYSYYVAPRVDDGKRRSVEGHIIRLGTAVRWNNIIYAGVTVKVLSLERPFFVPLTAPQLDVGVTWQIVPLLSLSVVGYNLIYNDSGETPITMGVGLAFGYQFPFRATVDWIIDFQSHDRLLREQNPEKKFDGLQIGHELRVGLEFEIVKIVTLRAGYQYDHVRNGAHYISFGAGFKYWRIGVEAAFRQQIAADRLSENRTFALTARLFF